jgi:plastocyanin
VNTRRILLVLALLAAGLLGTATSGETAQTVQILARDNVFQPGTAALETGDTVAWRNAGDVAHTVTAVDGSFDVTLRRGQEYRRTFAKPGDVAYYCSFHGTASGGGMAGSLSVTGTTVAVKDRIAGDTRVQTAIELSRYQFPDGADEVYLSNSDLNPDALVGGALTRGPILLVPSCGDLPGAVRDEIDRLDPVKIVALGGPSSVCESILDQAVAP